MPNPNMVPSHAFWCKLAELIRLDAVDAAKFVAECADLIAERGSDTAIDYAGACEELQSLIDTPQGGQPTSGDGGGKATMFALVEDGEVIAGPVVVVGGPADDRHKVALTAFAEEVGMTEDDIEMSSAEVKDLGHAAPVLIPFAG